MDRTILFIQPHFLLGLARVCYTNPAVLALNVTDFAIDVPTPADHGLPYEDLSLDTSDGVRIKSYLLVQRRHLPGDTRDNDSALDADIAEEDRKVSVNRGFATCKRSVASFVE
jgi:hypothetical protein